MWLKARVPANAPKGYEVNIFHPYTVYGAWLTSRVVWLHTMHRNNATGDLIHAPYSMHRNNATGDGGDVNTAVYRFRDAFRLAAPTGVALLCTAFETYFGWHQKWWHSIRLRQVPYRRDRNGGGILCRSTASASIETVGSSWP